MRRRILLLASLLPCSVLIGCATTGEQCSRPLGDATTTPNAVVGGAVPKGGVQVTWGGVLAETRNRADNTQLEVVAYPLDDCGRPRLSQASTGRFIIHSPGYLEAGDYRHGRQVTASGRIDGLIDGRVGEASMRMPVLVSYKPRLWPERDEGTSGSYRPRVSVGIGGGTWGGYGGVGVWF